MELSETRPSVPTTWYDGNFNVITSPRTLHKCDHKPTFPDIKGALASVELLFIAVSELTS